MQLQACVSTWSTLSKSCKWGGLGTRLINIDHYCKWWKAGQSPGTTMNSSSYWFPQVSQLARSENKARIRSFSWKKCFFVSKSASLKKSLLCYVWRNHLTKFVQWLHGTTWPLGSYFASYTYGIVSSDWKQSSDSKLNSICLAQIR